MSNRILSMLSAGLRLRCPRCHVGPLYRRPFSMHNYCLHCGLKFEREQGYFVGAIYINYAATVAIAVPGFFLLDALTNMTIHQQLAIWVPFAVVFPLLFFHHSRSLWLALDHLFNPAKSLYPVPPKKPASLTSSDNESPPAPTRRVDRRSR
jgi:uncharacterized protein (DUF983 family)